MFSAIAEDTPWMTEKPRSHAAFLVSVPNFEKAAETQKSPDVSGLFIA
jgi:hypothetical protein